MAIGLLAGELLTKRTLDVVLYNLKEMEERIMATIADVQTEVTKEDTVIASAITLLGNLSQMLKDALAANDPAAIQKVIDDIDLNTTALANAVAANTPAAPATTAPTQ